MGREKCQPRRDAEAEGAVTGGVVGSIVGAIFGGPVGAVFGAIVGAKIESDRRGEAVRRRRNKQGKCHCK